MLSLHEEAAADRIVVAEMRRDVSVVVDSQRDAYSLIDDNAERVAKLQVFTEDAVVTLKGISDRHTEAMDSLRRINAQQDRTIGRIQGTQKLVGKAISEILAVQASQIRAFKKLAERVGK